MTATQKFLASADFTRPAIDLVDEAVDALLQDHPTMGDEVFDRADRLVMGRLQ